MAENLSRAVQGAVSLEDLRSYEVEEREAIHTNINNFRVSLKLV